MELPNFPSNMAHRVVEMIHSRPGASAAIVAGTSLVLCLPYARRNYLAWLELGPGGPPKNVFGWTVQSLFGLLSRYDCLDPAPYTLPKEIKAYRPHGRSSFLDAKSPMGEREGGRPEVPSFAAPQRQTSQLGTPEMRARMEAHLDTIAAADPKTFSWKLSKLEGGHGMALWLADGVKVPHFMPRTEGELAHIHLDGSSHITLSLKDAEEALAKGWGQRHCLSGAIGIPLGYTMFYVPRNNSEFEVWKEWLDAGRRFVTTSVESVEK